MFQHVTVLVSFIFAIALTHVFSSASQLLLARDRVRFSALLTVAMINAALGVIINWLGLWQLENIKHWSLGEVVLQLGWVIQNYFRCSLVAMRCSLRGGRVAHDSGGIDFSSRIQCAAMGDANCHPHSCCWVPDCAGVFMGVRDHARRNCARIGGDG